MELFYADNSNIRWMTKLEQILFSLDVQKASLFPADSRYSIPRSIAYERDFFVLNDETKSTFDSIRPICKTQAGFGRKICRLKFATVLKAVSKCRWDDG